MSRCFFLNPSFLFFSLSLSLFLFLCLSVSLSLCFFVFLSFSVFLSLCLSFSLSPCLSVSLSRSLCLSLAFYLLVCVCGFVALCASLCLFGSFCVFIYSIKRSREKCDAFSRTAVPKNPGFFRKICPGCPWKMQPLHISYGPLTQICPGYPGHNPEDAVASFFVGTNFPKYSRYFGKIAASKYPEYS